MKKNIYKTSFLTICILVVAIAAQAQLQNFIKVDTGAMTLLWGGHASSTCFDMDNDGDLDIASGNKAVYASRVFSLFRNERNGYYIEMPEFTGDLELVASIGDVDNDGNIDLLVGPGFNFESVSVYLNSGNGNFQFDNTYDTPEARSYPTLLDLNNDGFLDVIGIDRWGSVLYNDESGGFLDWTYLGMFQQQTNVFLHGVSWGDADDDGDLDFFGGYSSLSGGIPINLCFLNNGDGSFSQFNPSSPIVEGECVTTCANWVDYDNDGDMDLYVHNVICDNTLPALYENMGGMEFTRKDIIDEMYRYSLANSSVWGDLDNDGDLDLFISVENNEFPWPPPDTSATPYNVIYLNDGNGQFTNILNHPLTLEDSHTALLLDHDNDGDLDVLLSRYSWSNDGHNNIFENEGNNNSWISLTCEGTISNRSAIGTRVQAKAFVNGSHTTQTREITPINGHLSYANLRVHFGLGDAATIDTLIFRWPSGIVDTYLDVAPNRFYRAIEDYDLTFLCPPGDISFTTQEQIDNFPTDHPDCVEIAGNVEINGSNITNLDGLLQIQVFGGHLEIYGNISLPDLSGLDSVSSIAGDFKVFNNTILSDFSGMGTLNSIGGNFQVTNNAAMKNMNGLENLSWNEGDLLIGFNDSGPAGNPALQSLKGIEDLDSVGGSIKIMNNSILDSCHVYSICGFIVDPEYTDRIWIDNNATHCNSIGEVDTICRAVSTEEIEMQNSKVIIYGFPNPLSSQATIEYDLIDQALVELKIYNYLGKEIDVLVSEFQQAGTHQAIWNAEGLPAGVYFYRLTAGAQVGCGKIIKR
jgi:hypothetical protein